MTAEEIGTQIAKGLVPVVILFVGYVVFTWKKKNRKPLGKENEDESE